MKRPEGNNADEWTAWFFEHAGHGAGYLGVQIAEAIDEHVARTALLDRMQTVRMILLPHDENEAICVGGKFDGWQMRRHPDGQWVSIRKLAQEQPRPPAGLVPCPPSPPCPSRKAATLCRADD